MRFAYETTEDSSYVVATFSDGEAVDKNQLQMLADNDLKNIIKPSYRFIDKDVLIFYNITSRISLEQATAKSKISKNGFINIIEGALSALEEVENHGLYGSGIVFDETNVYVKAGTYEPCFVYLPCAVQGCGIELVKKFILSLVTGCKIERLNDGFIQTLFDTLNNPNLCANDLRELCEEQKKGRKSAAKLAKNARFSVITPTMIDSESEFVNGVYNKVEVKSDIPKEPLQENYSEISREVESTQKRKPNKYIFILLQLLFAGVITAISKSGFFDNSDGVLNIKYLLGIIGAVCIADFVIYRELFMNDKLGNENENDEKNIISDSMPARKAPTAEENKIPESSESPSIISRIHDVPQSLEQIYAGARGSEFDDTVLLSDENLCAYLEFLEKGILKKIKLDNDVITVGKLSSQCDYVISNNKISKIHAEFIVRENDYFVKDCNSTNGTYINGSTQRIASNMEYQIRDGDRIILANIEMTLRCG